MLNFEAHQMSLHTKVSKRQESFVTAFCHGLLKEL